jgi:hypothetical protein
MKAIAAVLVSSVVLAGSAWAADTHSFAGPSKAQFNALKAQVAALKKKNDTLTLATVALINFDKQCLDRWKGVKDYGGYSSVFTDGTTGTSSALDLAATGDTPDFYMPFASSDCTNKIP